MDFERYSYLQILIFFAPVMKSQNEPDLMQTFDYNFDPVMQ